MSRYNPTTVEEALEHMSEGIKDALEARFGSKSFHLEIDPYVRNATKAINAKNRADQLALLDRLEGQSEWVWSAKGGNTEMFGAVRADVFRIERERLNGTGEK